MVNLWKQLDFKCKIDINFWIMWFSSFVVASPSAPVFLNTTNENGEVKLIRGNEGDDLTVKCISRGGYPCPNVVLYKNYSFLSDAVTCTLDRTYNATSEYTFKTIPRSYDGASLHCKSSYNGSESIQSTTVQLYLYCKYNVHVTRYRIISMYAAT